MKSLNGYHRTLVHWLSELGISCMEEYTVGPYSIDIFINEMNLGVEVDGKMWHNKNRDSERDQKILEISGIPIIRILVGTKKTEALSRITSYETG